MNLPRTATVTIGDQTFEREIEYGTAVKSEGDPELWDYEALSFNGDRYSPEDAWEAAQRQFYAAPLAESDRLVLVWRFPDRGNPWTPSEPTGREGAE